ncbi:hypothetical protein SDC9_100097 [bioreactor metagenome]|uniref:Uncharacterized protein n=1 Tax=bioreactor metagenome TaxID=1076179 RepID=A0A645AJM4_9ZZZZ
MLQAQGVGAHGGGAGGYFLDGLALGAQGREEGRGLHRGGLATHHFVHNLPGLVVA